MGKPRFLLFVLAALLANTASAQDFSQFDTKQPIEINADSLEVLQQQQQAIFSGNVVATQGKLQLKSDKMTVHYRKAQEEKSDAQAVSKIEVAGSVFLATPDESARSQHGIYDVDASKIHLTGQVVLTRGENVVKGDRLEYDLGSGRSQIIGGVGATGEGGGKGRVRGLFVPESNKGSN